MIVDSRGRLRLGTRRPQASGSIEERRPGYFVVRVRAGVDGAGRPVVRRRAGRGTRADAARWLVELGTRPAADAMSRGDVAAVSAQVRWPIAPLLPYLRARAARRSQYAGVAAVIVELAGINRATAHRWLRAGTVSDEAADRLATGLGLHPATVWAGWCDVGDGFTSGVAS